MNKAMKGAIAAGAAGILLLGGVGTFALWQDEQNIDAGTISTGKLSMTAAPGTWKDSETGSEFGTNDISAFDIVPGDSLTYTTTVTVKAEGENLKAQLIAPTAIQATVTRAGVPALEENIDVSLEIDPLGVTDVLQGEGNVLTFADVATYNIPVSITVSFADVAGNAALDQDLEVDLTSALTFTLQQV
jgi:alternate signal-mediated exported protein